MRLIDFKRKHGPAGWIALAERVDTSLAYLNRMAYGYARPGVDMATALIWASDGQVRLADLLPSLAEAESCASRLS